MSIIKKIFGGLFSSEAPVSERVDLLDLHQQNLNETKAEAKAFNEFETSRKAEELKLLERKAKLASIDRELESTFNSMAAGHKRVKKIEKRIAVLKQEEQENLQAHFDKARELRAKFEASLWEDDEEAPAPVAQAPAPVAQAPAPVAPPRVVSATPPVIKSEAPEETEVRPATEKQTLKPRGKNPNVGEIPPVNLG